MQIVPYSGRVRPRPFRGLVSPSLKKGPTLSSKDGFSPRELWRDYGIHPLDMARRAFWEKPLADGTPIQGGKPGDPLIARELTARMPRVLRKTGNLETFHQALSKLAREFGVEVEVSKGVPIVNWDSVEPARLDVSLTNGPSAYHEMVHACQCVIGGATALGSVAAEQFRQQYGRAATSLDELQPILAQLTPGQKREAMASYVVPMEDQAYSSFEETAFEITGLMGKRSRDQDHYRQGLRQVVGAYIDAYQQARAPVMKTRLESKLYGGLGHVARTNGETALLLGGTGLVYHQLAKQAMKIHPLMAVPVATPLAYLLYRAMVSG